MTSCVKALCVFAFKPAGPSIMLLFPGPCSFHFTDVFVFSFITHFTENNKRAIISHKVQISNICAGSTHKTRLSEVHLTIGSELIMDDRTHRHPLRRPEKIEARRLKLGNANSSASPFNLRASRGHRIAAGARRRRFHGNFSALACAHVRARARDLGLLILRCEIGKTICKKIAPENQGPLNPKIRKS